MAKSLKQLLEQIETLKKEAEEVRTKEVADVVARIKDAIEFYGLTADDLFSSKSSVPRKRRDTERTPSGDRLKKVKGARTSKAPVAVKKKSAPKYYGADGQRWTGVGKRPKWFVDALASGKTAEDMLILRHIPTDTND